MASWTLGVSQKIVLPCLIYVTPLWESLWTKQLSIWQIFFDNSDLWGISSLKSTRFQLRFLFSTARRGKPSHQPPSDPDMRKNPTTRILKGILETQFLPGMPPQNAKLLHEIMRWYDALFLRKGCARHQFPCSSVPYFGPVGFHCLFAPQTISLQVLCLAMMVLPVLHLGWLVTP